ncbi:unnamed protein product, partial [Ectocarpus sp. 13 AM-2016]
DGARRGRRRQQACLPRGHGAREGPADSSSHSGRRAGSVSGQAFLGGVPVLPRPQETEPDGSLLVLPGTPPPASVHTPSTAAAAGENLLRVTRCRRPPPVVSPRGPRGQWSGAAAAVAEGVV